MYLNDLNFWNTCLIRVEDVNFLSIAIWGDQKNCVPAFKVMVVEFQFLHGAIKGGQSFEFLMRRCNFNSYMVRLKVPFAPNCGVSVSGNGYWLLIPIAYPEQYNESKFFIEVLENHGWKIDKETSNKKYFTRPNKTSEESGEYDSIKNIFLFLLIMEFLLDPIKVIALFKFFIY